MDQLVVHDYALTIAVEKGNIDIINLLLSVKNIDVNAQRVTIIDYNYIL